MHSKRRCLVSASFWSPVRKSWVRSSKRFVTLVILKARLFRSTCDRRKERQISLTLAAELVRSKVDVIVASQTPAIMAAKNATRDIPIVMAPAGDPLALGFIASLARPGGNITGLSAANDELAAKSLELIREIIPTARRVGVLGNASDPFVKSFLEHIEQAAPMVHLEVQPTMICGNDELEGAFAAMARERIPTQSSFSPVFRSN